MICVMHVIYYCSSTWSKTTSKNVLGHIYFKSSNLNIIKKPISTSGAAHYMHAVSIERQSNKEKRIMKNKKIHVLDIVHVVSNSNFNKEVGGAQVSIISAVSR